ncbi:MAG: hypothetical protein ABJA02_04380 [Acidobacteriota bacterium]
MADWIGLILIIRVAAGVLIGIKISSRSKTRTSEEFERNAADGTTAIGALMNALQELMNPARLNLSK